MTVAAITYDIKTLSKATGLSPRTIERHVKAGDLPRPIRMGRRRLWIAEEVKAKMQQAERIGEEEPQGRGEGAAH